VKFENMPKPRGLFNSPKAEREDEGMFQHLTLSFSPLMNNEHDKHPDSPFKKETRESKSQLSGVAKTLFFDGGKRRSVKKSKNQKKTKRNNSTKKRRRTKKKKPSKN